MKARTSPALFFLLAAAFLGMTAAVAVPPFADDFDDGNDAGWVHYDPLNGLNQGGVGTWSFPSGAYRLFATPSLAPSTYGPARVGSYRTNLFSEFSVQMDIVTWGPDLDELFGVLARAREPGIGTTDGYGFTYSTHSGRGTPGVLEILRIVNERGTTIASFNITLTEGHAYRMVFTGLLTQLKGQLFDLTNSAIAVATLNAADSSFPNGYAGFFVYDYSPTGNHAVDLTVDNFSATPPQPRLDFTVDTTNQTLIVAWPTWAVSYGLEQAFELPHWFPANFDTVTSGSFFRHTVPLEDKSFFRLVSP